LHASSRSALVEISSMQSTTKDGLPASSSSAASAYRSKGRDKVAACVMCVGSGCCAFARARKDQWMLCVCSGSKGSVDVVRLLGLERISGCCACSILFSGRRGLATQENLAIYGGCTVRTANRPLPSFRALNSNPATQQKYISAHFRPTN
jgi:hypothetical protein